MAVTFRVRGYSATGRVILDATQVDETGEGPAFYAFHALHADGVTCVAIYDSDQTVDPGRVGDTPVFKQCDPGVQFDDVVLL